MVAFWVISFYKRSGELCDYSPFRSSFSTFQSNISLWSFIWNTWLLETWWNCLKLHKLENTKSLFYLISAEFFKNHNTFFEIEIKILAVYTIWQGLVTYHSYYLGSCLVIWVFHFLLGLLDASIIGAWKFHLHATSMDFPVSPMFKAQMGPPNIQYVCSDPHKLRN